MPVPKSPAVVANEPEKVNTPRNRKKLYAASRRGSPEEAPNAPAPHGVLASGLNRRAKALFSVHPTLDE